MGPRFQCNKLQGCCQLPEGRGQVNFVNVDGGDCSGALRRQHYPAQLALQPYSSPMYMFASSRILGCLSSPVPDTRSHLALVHISDNLCVSYELMADFPGRESLRDDPQHLVRAQTILNLSTELQRTLRGTSAGQQAAMSSVVSGCINMQRTAALVWCTQATSRAQQVGIDILTCCHHSVQVIMW